MERRDMNRLNAFLVNRKNDIQWDVRMPMRKLALMCSWTPVGPCLTMILSATIILLNVGCGTGMQLTSSGPRTIQRAEGEKVTLACTYTPGPADTGELDVEWSIVSPDTTQRDQMLLSFSGGKKYVHGSPSLMEGLDFAVEDPSKGDASLSVASLSPEHSATYQCKVKKSPGVDMRKVSLVVMVKPSVPRCWVEGGEEVGQKVSLHCESSQGSRPLAYAWKMEDGSTPAEATQNAASGDLVIRNHSQSFAGVYQCEVTNAVGAERCRIRLKAVKPPNRDGVIAGKVVCSILLIFILILLVSIFIAKWRGGQRYEKEVSNEIREDAPAPESRPGSRAQSRHQGVSYSQLSTDRPSSSGTGRPLKPLPSPSSSSTGNAPLKYDSRYGYVV